MNKLKKILAVVLALAICAATVLGAWVMFFSDDVSFGVESNNEGLTLTHSFSDMNINTTLGPDHAFSYADFMNENGAANMTMTLEHNVTDIIDGCYNFTDDCVMTIRNQGITYNMTDSGNVIEITTGLNRWEPKLSCVQNSCPQTHDLVLTLTEA